MENYPFANDLPIRHGHVPWLCGLDARHCETLKPSKATWTCGCQRQSDLVALLNEERWALEPGKELRNTVPITE